MDGVTSEGFFREHRPIKEHKFGMTAQPKFRWFQFSLRTMLL
jgi:hypothetical protein